MIMKTKELLLGLGLGLLLASEIEADEGMWLFNDPPRKLLKERHQFEVTDEWLEHVQKSSVRFNSGGSGSFVSEAGLLMTNHDVGSDTLQTVSDMETDYLKTDFSSKTRQCQILDKAL